LFKKIIDEQSIICYTWNNWLPFGHLVNSNVSSER